MESDYGLSLLDITLWGDGLSVSIFAAYLSVSWWVVGAAALFYGVRLLAKRYRKVS